MRWRKVPTTTALKINNTDIGEDIETMLRKRMENKNEMNTASRPLLYSERKDGVIIDGDPRVDKWDVMQYAQNKIAMAKTEARNAYDKSKEEAAKAAKEATKKGGSAGEVTQETK